MNVYQSGCFELLKQSSLHPTDRDEPTARENQIASTMLPNRRIRLICIFNVQDSIFGVNQNITPKQMFWLGQPRNQKNPAIYHLLIYVYFRAVAFGLGFIMTSFERIATHPALMVHLTIALKQIFVRSRKPVSILTPVRKDAFRYNC